MDVTSHMHEARRVNRMAKSEILRQALDHLNEKYVDAAARLGAIDDARKKIKDEHDRLKTLVDETRQQIKSEEDLTDVGQIKPKQIKASTYEAKVEPVTT